MFGKFHTSLQMVQVWEVIFVLKIWLPSKSTVSKNQFNHLWGKHGKIKFGTTLLDIPIYLFIWCKNRRFNANLDHLRILNEVWNFPWHISKRRLKYVVWSRRITTWNIVPPIFLFIIFFKWLDDKQNMLY